MGTGRHLFKLRDLTDGEGFEVLSPPESVEILSKAPVELSRSALTPWRHWAMAQRTLAVRERDSESLSAAWSSRITPEAFQFVPAARVANPATPSLLIADDVGLGKTIEAGICMMELIARGRGQRILLVVPPALIAQWQDEMREKFGLQFHAIENASALARAQTALAEGIQPWAFLDRIVTSVDWLKRREVAAPALDRPWDIIVVDEAHSLAESGTPRNPYATQRTRLGRRLRESCRSLILLTATPHNGHSHSFRSLIELVEPTDATFVGDRETVHRRIGRSMVRRLKPQITRTGTNGGVEPAFLPRAPVRGIAVTNLSDRDREIFRLVSGYCSKTAKQAQEGEETDIVTFAMQIIRKRMLSSRTALASTIANRLEALAARGDPDAPPSRAELRELQSDLPLGEAEHERISRKLVRSGIPREARRRSTEKRQLRAIKKKLDEAASAPDAKFDALARELSDNVLATPNAKAIVFTEYRDTLHALKAHLEAIPEFQGRLVLLFGGLSARRRLATLNAFEGPQSRILLATDTASEGLNLQRHCHRLYHLELPWNPIRLEQRNGRIDRHGQQHTPRIGYFYHPDSPEDQMLDRLIQRIASMQDDKVSTPDILGLLSEGRVDQAIAGVDAEGDPAANAAAETSLFKVFDEERESFAAEMAPLLTAGFPKRGATADDIDPCSADPIIGDDEAFASLMEEALGPYLTTHAPTGVFSFETPPHLQGPGVLSRYAALTFRRSIAVATPSDEVTFVHRQHPLAVTLAHEAWRNLSLVRSPGRSIGNICARRHSLASDGPFVVFTFLATSAPPDGTRICVALDPRNPGEPLDNAVAIEAQNTDSPPGEVPWSIIDETFGATFDDLAEKARIHAESLLQERLAARRAQRETTAAILREDAASFRDDRLTELDREERAASLSTDRTDQTLLFGERTPQGFKSRRAAVETFHKQRLAEIERYVRGEPTPPLHPLGALLVFPPA